jgi:hypothetical protein
MVKQKLSNQKEKIAVSYRNNDYPLNLGWAFVKAAEAQVLA